MRDRTWGVKMKELAGRNKDPFIGKAKAVGTSKAKQGIHCPLSHGKVSSHVQGTRLYCLVVCLRRQMPWSWTFPTLPPSQQLLLPTMTPSALKYPFGQLGLSLPPSKSLCTLSLLSGGVGWGEEQNDPDCVKSLFSNTKNIPVGSTVFPAQIPNTAPATVKNFTPAKTSTAYPLCSGAGTQPTALWWCTTGVTGWSCLHSPCGTCIYSFPPSHFWHQ